MERYVTGSICECRPGGDDVWWWYRGNQLGTSIDGDGGGVMGLKRTLVLNPGQGSYQPPITPHQSGWVGKHINVQNIPCKRTAPSTTPWIDVSERRGTSFCVLVLAVVVWFFWFLNCPKGGLGGEREWGSSHVAHFLEFITTWRFGTFSPWWVVGTFGQAPQYHPHRQSHRKSYRRRWDTK